jgi:hypothetical protein
MALDYLGNTYVGAYLYYEYGHVDYGMVKFDSAGADQGFGRYSGPFKNWDEPYGITADDAGNVHVTGRAFVTDSLRTDFATVKFVVPNDQPQISARPRNLYSLLHQNQVADTILKVFNEGTATMDWTLEENPDGEWVSEDPTSDSLSPGFWTDVAVRVNTAGLAPGFYYTNLVLINNDPNEPQRKVSVEIRVLPGTGVSDGPARPVVPKTFALENSQPNPFSAQTLIRYAVPRPSQVRLAVYDCSGALVRTLRAGIDRAGYYRVVWDSRDGKGRQVAEGVYFCCLQAGDFTATRKMSKVGRSL